MTARSEISITLGDVKAARTLIEQYVIRTPTVLCDSLSEELRAPAYLKLENLQRTGAFKVRGAIAKVSTLGPEGRARGIVCASSGNHGIGVAYAARLFKSKCLVVLPENASEYKVSQLEKYGAEILRHGITSDARQLKESQLSRENGFTPVPSFADPVLIAGQGTIGLEILEDLCEIDEVYVPVGGGGLISGIAVAIKEQRPAIRIYGVEPERADTMREAVRHQQPVLLPDLDTMADGLAAAITADINLAIVNRYVDDIILVSEQDILAATIFLLERAKVLAEPSSATSVAGLLGNPKRAGKAVAVISGGNISIKQIAEYNEQYRLNGQYR